MTFSWGPTVHPQARGAEIWKLELNKPSAPSTIPNCTMILAALGAGIMMCLLGAAKLIDGAQPREIITLCEFSQRRPKHERSS